MATALITHPACLGHVTPDGHPERVARLAAVLKALRTEEFRLLTWLEAPEASREGLAAVHSPELVAFLIDEAGRKAGEGFVGIDADTVLSKGSIAAALRAAGAVQRAIDGVMAGEFINAFCPIRPPGHHAERDRAMGFCLFNNVAIGAHHARVMHGLKRIAVIDFDVHHGNGTQDIFQGDADLFYASTHQSPLYPGTGRASEHGVAGNIVNAPLPSGADGESFRAAFRDAILPALAGFAPDFVLISAGFDAHKRDPLAQLALDETDFGWATKEICAVAGKACSGRVVSALEGGYDLEALAASSAAHVRALMEA
ncbi:MAG TPA: histone deacetylase family protein [Rhizomicrobium sp.]|jgi:acetoin utilization deacetylase AcuC-like enzyme